MFNSAYTKSGFAFILLGLLILFPCFVLASSNPYYIGPSGSIEGSVTDENSGTPIANASIYYTAGNGSMWYGFYYATTDENGKFGMTNVIPGNGVLTVGAKWYKDEKIEVEVASGDTTNQIINLIPVETGGINGTVKNALTGDPVPGILVSVFPDYYIPMMMKGSGMKGGMENGMENVTIADKNKGITIEKINPSKIKEKKAKSDKKHKKKRGKPGKKEQSLTEDFASLFFPNYYMENTTTQAVTDSNGDYSFEKLQVGSYLVYVDLDANSGFSWPDGQTVELIQGLSQTADFELNPLPTGTVRGNVINPKGDAVFGAIVDIYNDSFYGYTVTDENGNFSMISVPAGDYQVTALSQDFWLSSKIKNVTVKEGEETTVSPIKFEDITPIPVPLDGDKNGNNDFTDMAEKMMMERNMMK